MAELVSNPFNFLRTRGFARLEGGFDTAASRYLPVSLVLVILVVVSILSSPMAALWFGLVIGGGALVAFYLQRREKDDEL